MSAGRAILRGLAVPAAIMLLAALAGCGGEALVDERNIYYIRGMKLREEKRHEDAVEAFETCLRLSPQSAQAHLQLGLLYDEPLNDPLVAVYHYRRFLEMRPDDAKADAVRGWLRKAEETLRQRLQQAAVYATLGVDGETATGGGLDASAREAALLARIQELNAINAELRRQVDEPVIDPRLVPAPPTVVADAAAPPATGGMSASPMLGRPVEPAAPRVDPPASASATSALPADPAASTGLVVADPVARPPGATPPAAAAALTPVRSPATTLPVVVRPPPASPSAIGAGAPAGGVRIHVVTRGDTLSSLARRYYGSISYWPQIKQANRDVLGDRDELKPGMRLRLPPVDSWRGGAGGRTPPGPGR